MASAESHLGLGPQATHDFDTFLKNPDAPAEGNPTGGKFAFDGGRSRGDPEAQNEPPVREDIDVCRLVRQDHWMA
jgi:hypothetical protein